MIRTKQHKYRLLGKIKLQFYSYLIALITKSSRKTNKFVILGQSRTGSSLFVDLLNSHPKIACEREIFDKRRHLFDKKVWFPYFFLRGMALREGNRFFGFKVHLYQLTQHQKVDPNYFLSKLEYRGYKIIYLRRNNFLNQALSGVIVQKRFSYHLLKNEIYKAEKIEVSIEELENKMQRRVQNQKKELACLSGRIYHEVIYERDLENSENHQKTCLLYTSDAADE